MAFGFRVDAAVFDLSTRGRRIGGRVYSPFQGAENYALTAPDTHDGPTLPVTFPAELSG
jgi:hypothetical protein